MASEVETLRRGCSGFLGEHSQEPQLWGSRTWQRAKLGDDAVGRAAVPTTQGGSGAEWPARIEARAWPLCPPVNQSSEAGVWAVRGGRATEAGRPCKGSAGGGTQLWAAGGQVSRS